jgi:glycosyltransferase involved in cell wall biosynthesis
MRVVILADFAVPNGGAPKVALESARALAEAGVAVTYLHAIGETADALLDHPAIARIGLGFSDVWDLPAVKGLAAGLWNAAAARRVGAYLAQQPAGETVVHLHQWTRAFSPSIFPVLAGSGHPFAVTLHDYFLACPNGLYYRFEKERPCDVRPMSWACLTAPCDPKNSFVKAVRTMRTGLTSYGLQRASFHVIHVSDRGRDTITPLLPFEVRHHRVDNPVDIPKKPPAEVPANAAIAFVGRLTHEKGADLVAAAAKSAGVEALFIGDGPLAAELRRIHPDAECLGWRSPAEVDALLRTRVRAVVAPSRWYETGPLTVYEAMASGLPVVVSSRAGASEKIVHGETGFVVEPEIGALAGALEDLAQAERAWAMGRAAYDRFWAAPPTPAAHAVRLMAVYDSMLSRAGEVARRPAELVT